MRAAVERRDFLGAAQGCSADDDKGIAAAVMCSDLKINTDLPQLISRTGRRSTTRAVAGTAANVGGGMRQ
jgi:hypothetical protein